LGLLECVTKASEFAIPYWQCRDNPGYKVIEVQEGGDFYVSGNVGSWSGSYGNTMSHQDLAHYAKHENSILSPEPQSDRLQRLERKAGM